jgi:hypothetical protein
MVLPLCSPELHDGLMSPWADVAQAVINLLGTFGMICSLKTIRETGGVFATEVPHLTSPWVLWGFTCVVVAALPLPLARAFIRRCPPPLSMRSSRRAVSAPRDSEKDQHQRDT